MKKKKEVAEVRFKLIATRGEDEILSMKFNLEQIGEVMVETLKTSPDVILITKTK